MKRRVIKLNESDLQRLVKKIINETKKPFNEGEMAGDHPVFGSLNLRNLSDEDIEMIKRYTGFKDQPNSREDDFESKFKFGRSDSYSNRGNRTPYSPEIESRDGDLEHGTFDSEPCEKCGGLGYHEFGGEECSWCHGTGETQKYIGESKYGRRRFKKLNEEEKWIQKAIKHPGRLRSKMGVHGDEKIPSEKMDKKLSSLRKKDKDPKKPGVQGLSKNDLETYRQIRLAKRLKKYKS